MTDPTRGQEKAASPAVPPPKDVLPFGPALLLPTADSGVSKKLQAAREYVAAKEWGEAARALQDLLDRPEDIFLSVPRRGPDGKDTAAAVSLRAEVNRLLAGLPKPGLEAYESVVGPRARQALADAKGQPAALAAVVQRYAHTKAGADAAARLGAHHLDRGHFDLAAGYFGHFLRSAGADNPPPLLLFQAALAFRRAGDRDRAEQTWKRLAAAAPDGISAGDRTLPLASLEKELNRPAAADAAPARAALAAARGSQGALSDGTARAWLEDAVRRQEAASRPALPPAAPLAVRGKVVSRSQRGILAVDRESGQIAWESPSALGLDNLLRDPAAHAHVAAWAEAYLADHPNVLLENSVLGALSTDGSRVYAVDDLPVPPRPANYYVFHMNQGQGLSLADAPELTDAVAHSKLLAIDADSGKVLWELAGAGGPPRDCYFLGPPLPLGGKLYAPVQKGFDLRLLCLEPLTGAVVWAQTLVTFRNRMALDGGRRLRAVQLAYADGLLVCPTHAGGVVALDLVGRSLAWAHRYREEPPPPDPPPAWGGRRPRVRPTFVTEPPNLADEWRVSAPVIADGKVVFAAADAPELRCLDLSDGSLVWQAKRGDGDLFLAAAADDKVLIVGNREVRAVSLSNGRALWQCDTPAPAGRGATAGGAYRLPVRGPDGKAELLAIDIGKGTVTSRTPLPDGPAAGRKRGPEAMGAPEKQPGAARLAALVGRLGSESYAERERAGEALDAAGAPALGALRNAAASRDPEVHRRAAALVRAIERRVETAALLEPQGLRLQYKDTPLAEAAADFSKRSGVALKLPPELAKAADRKVTLDTGDVTFWEAFDQFCEKAGLVETWPAAPAPDPGGNRITVSSVVIRGGGVVRTPTDVLRTAPDERPLELTLGDGKPAPRPASLAGALRVCLAPPDAPIPHHKKEDGEALFALDVAAAGRLQWQKAVGLRIDRALDEDGRPLAQLPTSFKPPAAGAGQSGVIINGMPINPAADEPSGPAARLVAVRLKQPADKPAKKLKELTGTVIAQVRAPQEAMVTVENVLKAAGRTVKGRQGGAVKVIEAAKLDEGQVRLQVQVEEVSHGLADGSPGLLNATVIINGRRVGPDENLLSSLHFALLDEKGKPFRVVKAMSTGLRAGAAHEYELIYEPEPGQGEAAKFLYTDRRTLFVEVPFALKDVPLP
jgi:outer membrane protein assembly factor BamB